MSEVLQTTALPAYPAEIGRWLWAMEEVRHRTVALVGGLDQPTLDWEGDDGRDNAIGSLLYHIPLVEVPWLFLDILEQALPGHVQADFPHAMADDSRRLSRVLSVPLGAEMDEACVSCAG